MNNYWLIILLCIVSTQTLIAQKKSCACCTPEARQFDFWLGDWETYTPDGKLAGRNSITMQQDSCLIKESWTSNGSAYTGTSYNFFNQQTKKWQQLWIDNQGGNLQLEGEFKDGNMQLTSQLTPNKEGTLQLDRITWHANADGTVRQVWEVSTDKGSTWKIIFDGLYKRINH